MKTVKDFKDAGLVFVEGDMVHSNTGCETSKGESLMDCATRASLIHSFISIGDKFACGVWTIESFAWRTNKGVKPEFVGKMKLRIRCGDVMNSWEYEEIDWKKSGHGCDILEWRPHLPKVEDKPKSPYDVDAHVSGQVRCEQADIKPVFTQSMADAGELPMAGVTCEYKSDSGWRECFIVGMDQGDYLPVIQSYGALFFMPEDGLEFRPIQNEREKAIGDLSRLIDNCGNVRIDEVAEKLYSAGYRNANT